MSKRLRPRSAPPAIRRGPRPIEIIPAPPSLRPPRRSRSLPLSVKTWVNITGLLQDPGEGYSPRIGSEQAFKESLPDTATTMSSGSEAYSDQEQKATGAHEAMLEHVAAQNITLARAALSHFNAENPEDAYMLVTDDGTKAPISRVFVHDGPWFHCNFSARAKNDDGSGNQVVQFYAEIFYAETPRVMRCCVLTNVSESYSDRTCGFCGGNAKRDGILHPPDVLGFQNWLGLAKGVDSFARHFHNKPDHSRRRPKLEQSFHEMRIV